MPNHLAGQTSPYLLQHAGNPVDWYPWGPEALELARREDRPILLSIGYSACHWCHVMERESFTDEATARLMNEHFVSIKVDREERPDIDAIYMSAVQAMTGHGGWPMTVFLTPEGVPFYGGTYFPPEDRQGMPAFSRVLRAAATAFTERRQDVEHAATGIRQMYERAQQAMQPSGSITPSLLKRAYDSIANGYDAIHGGFGTAPKFPQTMVLDFLLRYWRRTGTEQALQIAEYSFLAMAHGGMYDQLGGGFHRYTVDEAWRIPHFEKMLYDNALLARLGTHLFQATRNPEIQRITESTVDWVAREMFSPEGGFYSALDADSEGEEGRFYLWSEEQLDALLGPDAAVAKRYWGVSANGNFAGRNILHVPAPIEEVAAGVGMQTEALEQIIARDTGVLAEARAGRIWPARDEKVLACWNGLMLRTLAEVARVFGRKTDREHALASGAFLFREMVRDDRVLRSYRRGAARIPGYLEDYAAVGLGALALYELTFDYDWAERAARLARSMLSWFWSESAHAFFDTASDQDTLITRPREVTDNATPAGTSLAVELLLRLGDLLDDDGMRQRATWVLQTMAEPLARYPAAFGHLLGQADMAIHGAVEVALVGEPASPTFSQLDREVAAHYLPTLILAAGAPHEPQPIPLLRGRSMRDARATAYVCRHYSCEAPVTAPESLGMLLEQAVRLHDESTPPAP
ncbi:MAG TPA: thioredoxin domain-containing protein [Gemmatimonadaceae bacterium]|nr:thioredoxin domain-containing protein [Gemmatimonadaceae bacterium]